MIARAIAAALKAIGKSPAGKIVAVAVFLFATSGPAVFAAGESPQSFWLQQREQADQAAKAATPKTPTPPRTAVRKPVHDFVPVEATRTPNAIGGAPDRADIFHQRPRRQRRGFRRRWTDPGLYRQARDRCGRPRARESSGLVRDDFYDWPQAAHDLAETKDKLDFVVVALGINDMQVLKDGADTLDPLSDKWREIYGKRVESVVAPFKLAHIPVAWVGLPPMRSERFNAQIVKLNELFKEQAEKAGAQYIDIWDAFADENGQYNAYGPDINGQNAKLRSTDGIHFTKAGARKLAQFLETDIKRAFDSAKPQNGIANLPPDIEQAAIDINAQIRQEMGVAPGGVSAPGAGASNPAEPMKPLAGPIESLTAKPLSPGGALVTRQSAAREIGPAERLLAQGAPGSPKPGRADDFSWPRL